MTVIRRMDRQNIASPTRPVLEASAQTRSAESIGAGLQDVGDMFQVWQDEVDTADAKAADAQFTEQMNELLYGDQTGFMYAQGGNAISRRNSTAQQIEAARDAAIAQLRPAARKKAEAALQARAQSLLQSVNRHTAGQRTSYLNEASQARVTASENMAIASPGEVKQQLGIAAQEVRDMAAREGWPPEKLDAALSQSRDRVHKSIMDRMLTVSPDAALDYFRDNRDQLSGQAQMDIERDLIPIAKAQVGRRRAASAMNSADMVKAMDIAKNTLGMDENAQRDALKAYMADGGVTLDPAVTSWCAAFVDATLAKAGMGGTGSLAARSFLEWGQAVDTPQRGDVVVLSRGDPNGPHGHVGFFDGFDEDGSVRILGGNQGNAVTVESFAASRILGFRRATGAVTEGSVAKAMRLAAEEEDMDIRNAMLDEISLRSGIAELENKEAQQAATDTVLQHIEGGGSINDLPSEVRQSLPPESLAAGRRYEAQKRSGEAMITDQREYVRLSRMAADDPQAFINEDPLLFRFKLDNADFEYFVTLQRNMKTQGANAQAAKPPAISTMLSTADASLIAAGFPKTESPEEYAEFQGQLTRWAQANPVDAGNPVALQAQINAMLTPMVINPSGMFNQRSGSLFQFDTDGSTFTTDDDLTMDMMQDVIDRGGLTMNGETVTPEIEQQTLAALTEALGRAPTIGEMLTALALRTR